MKNLNQIIKSQSDQLDYHSIELDNKLKVIFVHDKDTKKSSAVLNVGRGSLSDPKEFNGLAHFLEHMLFMGSEKYPQSSYYRDFITKHGGVCNAFTAHLKTCYYFKINKEQFLECLDIFG